ncbi:MAG TPA: hypothetical protein VGA80_07900 [Flavobacteriaceae bacterium]
MDVNIPLILAIIIPFYSGLGFLAHSRFLRFQELANAITYICGFIFFIGLIWNLSTFFSETSITSDIVENYEIEKKVESAIQENYFEPTYWLALTVITSLYLQIIQYIFNPESEKKTSSNGIEPDKKPLKGKE